MNRRRRFLLQAALGLLPAAALAQRPAPRRIGLLSLDDPEPYAGCLRDAMKGDAVLDVRSAGGKADVLNKLALELVRGKAQVMVAHEAPAVAAAGNASSTLPIVMAPGDRLAAPNITGIAGNSALIAAKMLDHIREVRSRMRRIAVLANRNDPFTKSFLAPLQEAANRMRLGLGVALVADAAQMERAFAEWDKLRVQAVVVQPSLPRNRAIELAARYGMPSVSPSRSFVEAGGLMSYAHDPVDLARKSAGFIARLLGGAKAKDLPVEQATSFELALNLKTAGALGLELADTLLARVDVIVQ
ncbi:MAG TPA: ABC transporter substrate-binding protein [Burkholderiales bacterium]